MREANPGRLAGLFGPVVVFLAIAAVVYAAAVVWAGSSATLEAAGRIGWVSLALGTAVACTGYLARFARWHLLLSWLGHRLPPGFGLRVYMAGFTLTISPGKVGETCRSLLLLPRGVRVSHSLAAFFADRLSDVIGVAALGMLAGWVAGVATWLLATIAVAALTLSLLAQRIVESAWLAHALQRARESGRTGRWIEAASRAATAWAEIWGVRRGLVCAACGLAGFGVQAWVFWLYVDATGAALGAAHCIAIFASSTLVGAASMIPAGLGTMEAALVYQLTEAGVPSADALAATLATRLSTLWCALLLGSAALLSLARDLRREAMACLES